MFESNEINLGISSLNWLNICRPPVCGENMFEQALSETALAGFSGIEIDSFFPADLLVLLPALRLRRLVAAGGGCGTFLINRPYKQNAAAFTERLEILVAAGAKCICIYEMSDHEQILDQPLCGGPYLSDAQRKRLYDGLNRLGRLAAERGCKLCFHPRLDSVICTLAEIRRLLAHTEPDYVHLCFDTGHFALLDEDVAAAAREFGARISHVHLQDIREQARFWPRVENDSFYQTIAAGCFTVPGDGCIDYESVFCALDEARYSGWMIVEAEQDPRVANPFEYALKARHYLKAMLAVELEHRLY